jgi:uncharacterized membrane protein YccC
MSVALTICADAISETASDNLPMRFDAETEVLRRDLEAARQQVLVEDPGLAAQSCFVFARLEEIITDCGNAARDWPGHFGLWKARRPSYLAEHRDYRSARIYGMRMLLAMGLAISIWAVTRWPSGSQLILFMAVVCSLLSLLENAPVLGTALLKSAFFCFAAGLIESFWLMQQGEGFLLLAAALGVFLLPAAYAYQHPRLTGGAVISMLIFYGLTMPANRMNYDIVAFLNNGMALLCAVGCGFFAFHAVPSLSETERSWSVRRAVRRDLAGVAGLPLAEQHWATLMMDRFRLLDRSGLKEPETMEALAEAQAALQLGMRRIRLRDLIPKGKCESNQRIVEPAFRQFHKLARRPAVVADAFRIACRELKESTTGATAQCRAWKAEVVGDMEEMIRLIEGVRSFAQKQ